MERDIERTSISFMKSNKTYPLGGIVIIDKGER